MARKVRSQKHLAQQRSSSGGIPHDERQPDGRHVPPQTAYLIGYNVGALRMWRKHLEFGPIAGEGEDGLVASSNHLLREVTRFADSLPAKMLTSFNRLTERLRCVSQRIIATPQRGAFGQWDRAWDALRDGVTTCMNEVDLGPWYRLGGGIADYETALLERVETGKTRRFQDLPPLTSLLGAVARLPPPARKLLPSAHRLARLPASSPLKLLEAAIARKGMLSGKEDQCFTATTHAIDFFHKQLLDELGTLPDAAWQKAPSRIKSTKQEVGEPKVEQTVIATASPIRPPMVDVPQVPSGDGFRKGYLGLELNSGSHTARRKVKGKPAVVDLSSRPTLWNLLLLLEGAGDQWVSKDAAHRNWGGIGSQAKVSNGTIDDAYSVLRRILGPLGVTVKTKRRTGSRFEQLP